MILCTGNMWDAWPTSDLFCITTCNTLKANGALVMGAGIAKQARDRLPGIDLALGHAVTLYGPTYGLITSKQNPPARLAAFQTKAHWRSHSSLSIIYYSAHQLLAWCEENPTKRVDLNFPGIGCRQLSKDAVLTTIEMLPDQVHVWTYGEKA